MSTLHLGVIDVAYSDSEDPGVQTTFGVAVVLERKYGVMATFVKQHADEIVEAVTDRYRSVLNRVLERNRSALHQREWPMPKIGSAFRDYLATDEWQKVTGHTIAAARAGVSHRLKNPKRRAGKAKGQPRPAFIDTGLYSRSFRAAITP